MRASTRFPMAVHALLMIAYFPDIRVTSEMVAESVGTNPVVIRTIYGRLKKAGLLSVQRGKGATALTRPARDITLWDVYAAVEADLVEDMFAFPETLSGACPVGGSLRELMTIHLHDAIGALRESLSRTTIEELRREIEAHHERELDFPAIVAWYREQGFDQDASDETDASGPVIESGARSAAP